MSEYSLCERGKCSRVTSSLYYYWYYVAGIVISQWLFPLSPTPLESDWLGNPTPFMYVSVVRIVHKQYIIVLYFGTSIQRVAPPGLLQNRF